MSAQKKLKQSKNNTEFLTNKENFLKFANSIKLVSPIFGLEKAEFTATHGLLFEAIENHDHVAVFRQRQYFHMSTFLLVYCLWLAEINKFPQRIGFFCTNGLSSVLKQKGFQELLKNNNIPFKTLADTIKLKDSGVEIQFQPAAPNRLRGMNYSVIIGDDYDFFKGHDLISLGYTKKFIVNGSYEDSRGMSKQFQQLWHKEIKICPKFSQFHNFDEKEMQVLAKFDLIMNF